MSEEPNLVPVEIHGRTYNLRSPGDPRALKELAAYVDARMAEIAEAGTTADTARLAVLAALNIADELFDERRRGSGVPTGGAVAKRDEHLIRTLDEILLA